MIFLIFGLMLGAGIVGIQCDEGLFDKTCECKCEVINDCRHDSSDSGDEHDPASDPYYSVNSDFYMD